MKVYLDDERATPEGWVRCYWPDEAIRYLETRQVTHLSLDHDLGDDVRGTGYDVVLWLEKTLHEDPTFPFPYVLVHSQNVSAKAKMELALRRMKDKFT